MEYLYSVLLVGGTFFFILLFLGLMAQTGMEKKDNDTSTQPQPTVHVGRRDRKIQR